MTEFQVIRCVAVGDGFVGKTNLLASLTDQPFHEFYAPTIFENTSIDFNFESKKYELHLIDTAGQETYVYIRTQMYANVDVFLCCFSVSNVDSFVNIREVWMPEVQAIVENPKFVLLGLKSDLRRDPETIDQMNISQEVFVSESSAQNFASNNNIIYIECSAKTKENIDKVKEAIVQTWKKGQSLPYFPKACCTSPLFRLLKKVFCCNRYLE